MNGLRIEAEVPALPVPGAALFMEACVSSPSFTKRQKEQRRLEKQQEKAAKRTQRKLEKVERAQIPRTPGEDPDLAGIVPGPQPSLF